MKTTHTSPGVTVVILTLNESRDIARCITSARGVADEIIVVDSGSTDDTLEIASRLGARIISQEWLGYGAQRNVGVDAASHDWIFVIDADEVLTSELAQSVKRAVESAAHPRDVYGVDRPKDFLGTLMPSPARKKNIREEVRLFNRSFARYDNQLVHERVIHSGQSSILSGALLHLQNLTYTGELSKLDKYSSLEAQARYAAGIRPNASSLYVKPILRFLWVLIAKGWIRYGWKGFAQAAVRAFWEMSTEVKLRELRMENGEQ